jgi:hypothetical protein
VRRSVEGQRRSPTSATVLSTREHNHAISCASDQVGSAGLRKRGDLPFRRRAGSAVGVWDRNLATAKPSAVEA